MWWWMWKHFALGLGMRWRNRSCKRNVISSRRKTPVTPWPTGWSIQMFNMRPEGYSVWYWDQTVCSWFAFLPKPASANIYPSNVHCISGLRACAHLWLVGLWRWGPGWFDDGHFGIWWLGQCADQTGHATWHKYLGPLGKGVWTLPLF